MGLLDKIRARRQKSVLPEEVQQYYQSETRQKRGVAILLAVLALLVTIAVAAAIFFAGRFIYHKAKGDDNKKATPAQQDAGDFDKNNANNDQNKQTQSSNQGQSTPSSGTSTPAPPPKPAPQPAPAPANPTTPALGDDTLPHTGDEGM